MPSHVFVPCGAWFLDLDDPAACPTFATLLGAVAASWEVPVESMLVRCQLRLRQGGVIRAPFSGAEPPRLIENRVQALVHPEATREQIREAFESLDCWRPPKNSHAYAQETMMRIGQVVMQAQQQQAAENPREEDP
jgi:hypothetical protein